MDLQQYLKLKEVLQPSFLDSLAFDSDVVTLLIDPLRKRIVRRERTLTQMINGRKVSASDRDELYDDVRLALLLGNAQATAFRAAAESLYAIDSELGELKLSKARAIEDIIREASMVARHLGFYELKEVLERIGLKGFLEEVTDQARGAFGAAKKFAQVNAQKFGKKLGELTSARSGKNRKKK